VVGRVDVQMLSLRAIVLSWMELGVEEGVAVWGKGDWERKALKGSVERECNGLVHSRRAERRDSVLI
jgi:hypothetical protein